MKIISVAIISFIFGLAIAALVSFKLLMGLGYDAVIGKLTDNVIFYRQIEQGNPELTQMAISSSLDRFISLAEEGEESFWVSPDKNDLQALIRAKELHAQLTLLNDENRSTK
ncbi:hypothetical protein [Paraglaciecola marina]|uniref:hypothetical protein n=1 Tax=Paraglaciecola marina TaxID=2500157 RepID=UPI00106002B8|nr:hypothetical protein [Paraglaciecola marina]